MIGTLTKKFTARIFTLQFHCGLFPLHFCSMVSVYCNVLISLLSTPLPAFTTTDLGSSDLRPCMHAQHVECLGFSRKEKQTRFSLNSLLKLHKGKDGTACCWSFTLVACIFLALLFTNTPKFTGLGFT